MWHTLDSINQFELRCHRNPSKLLMVFAFQCLCDSFSSSFLPRILQRRWRRSGRAPSQGRVKYSLCLNASLAVLLNDSSPLVGCFIWQPSFCVRGDGSWLQRFGGRGRGAGGSVDVNACWLWHAVSANLVRKRAVTSLDLHLAILRNKGCFAELRGHVLGEHRCALQQLLSLR